MNKLLLLLVSLIILASNIKAAPWVIVPDYGDVGWFTYVYQTGLNGFTGTAGFVVSNVIDNYSYSELLLDNLSHGGGLTNRRFEMGITPVINLIGNSYAEVTTSLIAPIGNIYNPTQGNCFSHQYGLGTGVSTAKFRNAEGQAGTTGSILESFVFLAPGNKFSFDWAFLAGDESPWDDFPLFYLKNVDGTIIFSDGLAQIGSAPVPAPSTIVLLGWGLVGLLGMGWRAHKR